MEALVRILFVEHDPVNRQMFTRIICEKHLPYALTVAESLAEARSRLAQESFDAIVAERDLPDGPSIDLFAQLSEKPPVVIVGPADPGAARYALESGMDEYLPILPGLRHLEAVPIAVEKAAVRRATERRLHYEKSFSDSAINSLPGQFVLLDPEQHLIRWNQSVEHITGYSHEEIARMTALEFIAPEDRVTASESLGRVATVGEATAELRLLTKDGRRIPCRYTARRFYFDERPCVVAVGLDVTEQLRSEAARRESEERFRQFMDNSPTLAWVKDEDGRYVYLNKTYEERFGVRLDESRGKTDDQLWPAKVAARLRAADQALLAAGHPIEVTEETTESDGRCSYWLNNKFLLRDSDGKRYVASIGLDITLRKHAEEQLREQTQLAQLRADVMQALQRPASVSEILQQVTALLVERLDAAFARVWTLDPSGQTLELHASAGMYTHLNGAHSRVPVGSRMKIGVIAQERQPHVTNQVVGDPLVPQQDWARREGLVAFAGFPLLVEDRLMGVVALFARHSLTPATAETMGAVAGALALALARKQVEQTLRESEFFHRQTLESIPGMMFTCAPGGDCDWVSPQWVQFTGAPISQHLREGWTNYLHPDDRTATFTRWREAVAERASYDLEYRVRRHDGAYRWFKVRGHPIRDGEGRVVRWFGVALDIDDLKHAEASLAEVNTNLEKLVSERTAKLQETVDELEHFSYTITHDMRAPLRAMTGFSEVLLGQCAELHPETRDYLQRIKESAQRMDLLITDALSYSRALRTQMELKVFNPAVLLQGIVHSYPQLQAPLAEIQIDEPMPSVLGNEAGMTQCFSNLLDNAVKFVPPGVIPRIRVWAQSPSPPEARVRIWFEDNGIGIKPEHHDRIFSMFQQLDRSYEGTGIGLALVRKVARRMGGEVGVESEPGRGSRFWLELKAADPLAPTEDAHDLPQSPR